MPLVDEAALEALGSFAEDGMQTPIEVFRSGGVTGGEADPETGQIGSNELGDDVEEVVANEEASSRPAPIWSGLGWLHSELTPQATQGDAQVATVDIHELRLPRTADIKAGDEVLAVETGEFYQVIDVNDGDTYRVQTRASLRRRQG